MTQTATKTTISIATATIAAVTITTQITSTLVGQQQQKQNTNNNNYDDKNRDDNSNTNSNANNFEEGGGSVWSSFVCFFGSLSSLLALSLSLSLSISLCLFVPVPFLSRSLWSLWSSLELSFWESLRLDIEPHQRFKHAVFSTRFMCCQLKPSVWPKLKRHRRIAPCQNYWCCIVHQTKK